LWTAAIVVLFPVITSSTAPGVIGYAFYFSILIAGLIFFSIILDKFHVRFAILCVWA
jgi:hypothetical protein